MVLLLLYGYELLASIVSTGLTIGVALLVVPKITRIRGIVI